MADKSPNFALGEYSSRSVLESVEYTEAITSADIGTCLKITGVNDAGQMKVAKHTTTVRPAYIIPKGAEGKAGDIRAVLFRGDIKVNVGAGIGVGIAITANAGKIVKHDAGTKYDVDVCGFTRVEFDAAGDTGLICFNPA